LHLGTGGWYEPTEGATACLDGGFLLLGVVIATIS
jgi:hypothetical protein